MAGHNNWGAAFNWNGSSHSWTPSSSSTYGNLHDESQATGSTAEYSNGSSASTIAPLPSPATTPRRRRRFGRMMRAGSDTLPRSSSSNFNPEAEDFVPTRTANMPFKKKSYSFSKRGQASYISAPIPLSRDLPVIKASEIFRGDNLPLPAPVALRPSEIVGGVGGIGGLTHDYAHYTTLRGFRVDGTFASHHQNRLSMLRRSHINDNGLDNYGDEDTWRSVSDKGQSAILIHQGDDSTHGSGTNNAANSGRTLRYLPLVPLSSVQSSVALHNQDLTILPSHRARIDRVTESSQRHGTTWPPNRLPTEIFDLITQHLARDDTMAMRMVNKEFEEKVSRSLFYSSVVPFNTELYDMIDETTKSHNRTPISHGKGKGRKDTNNYGRYPSASETDSGGLLWQNAKDDEDGKVYKGHGLRVFQGFGPHIKRFGMSFEVSEDQLAHPPAKKELDHIESYHGSYTWPQPQYARFANLAGLERSADETSRMKAAFSNLKIVSEIALSIDNGLGWLNGADKSVRARIFDRPSAVFGRSAPVCDHAHQQANELWTALQRCVRSQGTDRSDKEINLRYTALTSALANIGGLHGSRYAETAEWSSFDARKIFTSSNSTNLASLGVLAVTSGPVSSPYADGNKPSSFPAELKKEQKEWLMETEWAQRAFLESYMLAVVDNPSNFQHVTTLRIAKLSSRYIPVLARESFWTALASLQDVTLHISADWRTVEKDTAGFAEVRSTNPSSALRDFHVILQDRIAPCESIRKLNIGWIGGGEHAEGMFARNSHLLPSPITTIENCATRGPYVGLVFPYIEHLTLTNCWVTPPVLEGLVRSHADKALIKLTLDSVSLTAHPGTSTNLPGVGGQNFAQAIAAMQAQLAQAGHHHPGVHIANPFPHMQNFAHGANAQQFVTMTHHLGAHTQQMMNHLNPNFHAGPVAMQTAFLTQLANGTTATAQAPAPHGPQSSTPHRQHWTEGYRPGSWPNVLNSISPGCTLEDFLPVPAPWEEQRPPRPVTSLRKLELKSCGYAKISHVSNPPFDQSAFDSYLATLHTPSHWFNLRANTLKSSMLESRDRHLAHIISWMPRREQDCLALAWGLRKGWSNPSAAEEAEYDGFPPGGTGRISGTIRAGVGASYQLTDRAE